jgi:hypothetical protein
MFGSDLKQPGYRFLLGTASDLALKVYRKADVTEMGETRLYGANF